MLPTSHLLAFVLIIVPGPNVYLGVQAIRHRGSLRAALDVAAEPRSFGRILRDGIVRPGGPGTAASGQPPEGGPERSMVASQAWASEAPPKLWIANVSAVMLAMAQPSRNAAASSSWVTRRGPIVPG